MTDNTTSSGHNKVNGHPTKKFFIDILTRDITVRDAIGDLVDNAVDAARSEIYRLAGKPEIDLFALKYENTQISINFTESQFSIQDNAGGIPYEVAKNYAFCFGRPEDFDGTPGSIGQFGIGMKRAFFKIGKYITIESSTKDRYFKIEIDVEKWEQEVDWDFLFTEEKDSFDLVLGYGTKITITDLYESTQSLFKKNTFINELKAEIEIENWYNISKGMKISINEHPLVSKDLTLKEDISLGLKIGRWQHDYDSINVRIVCGVGEKGKKEEGGWYIFCNDRLILPHEQTTITGWTGGGRKVEGGPEYHGQYERFRGFVFFESQKPSNFPWNTAKTGLNPEHPLYISVRAKMILMMKDVIVFLNNLKAEKDGQGRGKNRPPSPTEKKLDDVKSIPLQEIVLKKLDNSKFSAPETEKNTPIQSDAMIITYEVPIDSFNKIANRLDTNNPKEVGVKTFNYYMENEL